MTAPVKIASFLAMLVVVFAASLWVGNVFGSNPAFGPNPDVAVPHPVTGEQHPHDGAP